MMKDASVAAEEFLRKHHNSVTQILSESCLQVLLTDMERGLAGEGLIPMLPSYLAPDIHPVAGEGCWVLDAGGTNLRSASAYFDEAGKCHIEELRVIPMPGTDGALTKKAFYQKVASQLLERPEASRVGFCFSYNVDMERNLDGKLLAWCKEVQVPEAVGCSVGSALREALGENVQAVRVLNDSTAAMLGADRADVGLILGTGINVCYAERCANIPKVEKNLQGTHMIISTEVGAFDGFPKGDFDRQVIDASDIPEEAHAEKQCAGAYLGEIIGLALKAAASEGLLPEQFGKWNCALADVSRYLAGENCDVSQNDLAWQIADALVQRAARIAAVLTAGPAVRSGVKDRPIRIAVEGSTFWKLTGFKERFCEELTALLAPRDMDFEILCSENACLVGAALAAFAPTM